ncbi:TetR/AcrR family transcriptional regulator [Nafulsella turpanensis]|uniref:TetR/AcrR family transcriptional regulator n=1 Tax=Nafulsella turpanensis TaxID=1265690 RepID=UPI000349B29A|nr:TetR/AcrR family transcriptional regulator [Nafulsella turpanensis]
MEIKENIVDTAEKLFLRYGFKRITMDDIAREMAISKKTIYQYFKDKNEIVCCVTEQHLKRECHDIQKLEEGAENVIEYLVKLSKQLRQHIDAVNPGVMQDLKKYFPRGWKIFMHYKQEVFLKSMVKTLKKGMDEGYFRADIDPEVLGIMRMEQIQMSFDENLFPRKHFDFTEVQMQLLRHFVAGIITDKGRELLTNYENSTETNNEKTL